MTAMTRPALRPLTIATAAIVAGAAGVAPTTAAAAPRAPHTAEHSRAPHPRPGLMPAVVLPAEVSATVARGHGAGPAEPAASSVTVAGGDNARWERGIDRAARRPAVDVVRARGPPA
jgi:hypothetical protein